MLSKASVRYKSLQSPVFTTGPEEISAPFVFVKGRGSRPPTRQREFAAVLGARPGVNVAECVQPCLEPRTMETEKFNYVYSCDMDINVQLKM